MKIQCALGFRRWKHRLVYFIQMVDQKVNYWPKVNFCKNCFFFVFFLCGQCYWQMNELKDLIKMVFMIEWTHVLLQMEPRLQCLNQSLKWMSHGFLTHLNNELWIRSMNLRTKGIRMHDESRNNMPIMHNDAWNQ